MTDDERAIHDLVDSWMSATRAGDVDAVLDLLTDDALFMVPGQDPFGKEAFAEASRAMEGVHVDGETQIRELEVVGDRAWMRTRIRVTVTPKEGGEPIRRSGFALTVLRRGEDGRWRLARDANLVTDDG